MDIECLLPEDTIVSPYPGRLSNLTFFIFNFFMLVA